jgi:hypothetical protein
MCTCWQYPEKLFPALRPSKGTSLQHIALFEPSIMMMDEVVCGPLEEKQLAQKVT